jgi:hypothetical protein
LKGTRLDLRQRLVRLTHDLMKALETFRGKGRPSQVWNQRRPLRQTVRLPLLTAALQSGDGFRGVGQQQVELSSGAHDALHGRQAQRAQDMKGHRLSAQRHLEAARAQAFRDAPRAGLRAGDSVDVLLDAPEVSHGEQELFLFLALQAGARGLAVFTVQLVGPKR